MTKPLVSIVVPVYNHYQYVIAALDSIARQTYRPIEVIIIDDGSTDESATLVAEYLRNSPLNAIFSHRENRGAANTINQALQLSSGKYLTILNSDDYYHPERIERCVDAAERNARHFLFSDVEVIDDQGFCVENEPYVESILQPLRLPLRYPSLGYAFLKSQIAITTGNFFFSRELYVKVGAFRHYKYVHDWDFVLRAIFFEEPYFIDEVLYFYRFHANNSFKSLQGVEGYETSEVMRNCLWSMTYRVPENPVAPSPHLWPGFFRIFIEAWDYQVYMPRMYNLH